MKASQIAILMVVLGGAIVASGIFVWPALVGLAGPDGGLAPAIIMILGCFALGGALMFLLFYSARKGHDESVYRGGREDGDRP